MSSTTLSRKRINSGHSAWYGRVWNSRLFLLSLCVVAIVFVIGVIREVMNRVSISNEVARLQADIDRLQHRNTDISELIAVLDSDAQQDKQARAKLGVGQPGEQLVIFPQDSAAQSITITTPEAVTVGTPVVPVTSNPERWYKYFFSPTE